MKPLIAVAILLCAIPASAQTNDKAEEAFCRYTMEQAQAQRDLYRIPSGVIGPIQPSAGTPAQMVFGVTESLSDLRKAGLTMTVGRDTCAFYSAATEAQMKIAYALPGLEQEVLKHRISLIQAATAKLDGLIVENMKTVDAENLTRPSLYSLQNAKVRLDTSRTAALTGLASPYVPKVSDVPLRELVARKLETGNKVEASTIRLQKQSDWDIKLSGGMHRQITSTSSDVTSTGAYAEFSLTYNFGRKAINKHLDKSAEAFTQWKTAQFDDVSQQTDVLQHQINDTITAQEEELVVLHQHDDEIEKNLRSLDDVDTSAALAFKNELISDQTVLQVEIADIQFRINQLKQYLVDNF